jgi:hypothetical protein
MPTKKSDLPGPLKRSSAKAQRTFMKTKDSAEETYGEGRRAARTAYASLKHSFEKVGDHWEEKDQKGPSDEQAAQGGAAARRGGETKGGVDVRGNSKQDLYERAKEADIQGRSSMTKDELADALVKDSRRQDARRRRG